MGVREAANEVVIVGRGRHLPADVLTNQDIASRLDPARLGAFVRSNSWCRVMTQEAGRTSLGPARDASGLEGLHQAVYARFVAERVGIRSRHVVDRAAIVERRPPRAQRFASDLGAEAALGALAEARLAAEDLDLVICGTSTPDSLCPSTAVGVQERVGARRAFAFDISAACSSFVFALETARAFLVARAARTALVVSPEYFTCNVDYDDPETAYFFGDGAGAVVLCAGEIARGRPGYAVLDGACRSQPRRRITTAIGGTVPYLARASANGHGASLVPGEASYPWFHQDGPAVYRDVVPQTTDLVRAFLGRHGLRPADVRRYFFHQASTVMIEGIARRLGLDAEDPDRVAVVLGWTGNTSSAGIPIALAEERSMEPGDLACLVAFGGGYTLGTTLLRRVAA